MASASPSSKARSVPYGSGTSCTARAGVEHVFVGAGDGPCAVLMIGSRRKDEAHYPVNDVAAKYDASVESATDEPAEAYADWRIEPWRPTQNPWPLGG